MCLSIYPSAVIETPILQAPLPESSTEAAAAAATTTTTVQFSVLCCPPHACLENFIVCERGCEDCSKGRNAYPLLCVQEEGLLSLEKKKHDSNV